MAHTEDSWNASVRVTHQSRMIQSTNVWASRKGRIAAYLVVLLIHGTAIAVGSYFMYGAVLFLIIPSAAKLVAAGITTLLLVGGIIGWFRIIVEGQMPFKAGRFTRKV